MENTACESQLLPHWRRFGLMKNELGSVARRIPLGRGLFEDRWTQPAEERLKTA